MRGDNPTHILRSLENGDAKCQIRGTASTSPNFHGHWISIHVIRLYQGIERLVGMERKVWWGVTGGSLRGGEAHFDSLHRIIWVIASTSSSPCPLSVPSPPPSSSPFFPFLLIIQ